MADERREDAVALALAHGDAGDVHHADGIGVGVAPPETVDGGDTDGDAPHAHLVEDAGTATAATAVSAASAVVAASAVASAAEQPPRVVRGRYAKFTASMDVVMLEAMRTHNPFTAKHGTRLQMWQIIAETVGEATLKNPEAYSWHTCRDRVTTLMKLYADGKHDKLFKHGTVEENQQKEAILRELHLLLHRKGAKPGSVVRAPTQLEASLANPLMLHGAAGGNGAATAVAAFGVVGNGTGNASVARDGRQSAVRAGGQTPQKRRRADANGYAARTGDTGLLDTETFRARVLELMETKIQFDMEQRAKENELREHEFELQKRFLEYLQSK